MDDVLARSLYKRQEKQFEKVNEQAKAFAVNYCGNTMIRDSIFHIASNYARKRDLILETLRYPFEDDGLWAFTFIKKGTIFLSVNSNLDLNRQIFATAHELYHIHCYAEETNPNTIIGGSILDSKTGDETAMTQEDLEANAFAGLLLMPDSSLTEQIKLYGIEKEKINRNDVQLLMELFAIPFKAVVLRLYESKEITEIQANDLLHTENLLYTEDWLYTDDHGIELCIETTHRSQNWKQSVERIRRYGSLLQNIKYNSENDLLTEKREATDREYLEKLEKRFRGER